MPFDTYQAQLYKHLSLGNNYTIVSGKFALPVAQASPTTDATKQTFEPVVVVTAHAPYRIRSVNYTSTKDINPPQIPTPKDYGPYIFLGANVAIPLPEMNTSGSFTWSAIGSYTFIENAYSDKDSGYVLGQPPFIWKTQTEDAGQAALIGSIIVNDSGTIGPRVGWAQGLSINFNDPTYAYHEPSFFPPQFHSNDMINGPATYTSALPN